MTSASQGPGDPLRHLDAIGQSQGPGDPFRYLDPVADYWSEEAQNPWEAAKWQGAAFAKELGDAAIGVGTTAAKLIGGVGGMVSGEGFGAGWEGVAQSYEQTMGTRNPGVLEFGARIGQELGIPTDITFGKRTDELIDRRLGNSAVIGRSIGTVLSFATGPGAAVGRGTAALTKPIAQVGERMLAKAVGRTLGVADDATNALVSQGRAWDYFAQTAGMQGVMGMRQQILQAAGRNATDILSTTAANVAQAYALSPDDQRLSGVLTAAYMSPFLVPIARIGQSAERAIMEWGLGASEAAAIRSAVAGLERGEMSLSRFQSAVTKAVGPARRIAASAIVAPTIEGTAFMGLDPNAIDLAGKWMSGDTDAGAQLGGMLLGTTTGLAIAKYGMPDHLAPMWRTYRPDLNRLDKLPAEAEAARRAMETPQEPAKAPQQRPAQSIEGNEKLEAVEARKRREAFDAQAVAAERYRAAEATVQADYGWAAEPTAAMLKGDWRPTFNSDKSVTLEYGRDHMVTVLRSAEDGISVRLREPSLKVLRDFGLEPSPDSPDRQSVSTLETEIRGPLAQKALDDLAMIGSLRRMQADRNFERRGFREVMPGLWMDPGTGTYYTPQLDGTYATKDGPTGKWTGTDEMVVVGPAPELWDNPTAAALGEWALVKQATFPDPTVDGILLEAVQQARTGNSAGARNLRNFFERTTPEQLAEMLRPEGDREIAMKLGSIASTLDTPELATAKGMDELLPTMRESKPIAADQGLAETGSISPLTAQQRAEIKRSVGERAGQARDYFFDAESDVVTRAVPGEKLGYEAREVFARGAALTGEAGELIRPLEKKRKRFKETFKKEVVPQGYDPDTGTTPAWVDLFDARAEPSNATERVISEVGQAYNSYLRRKAVEAGFTRIQSVDGQQRRVPVRDEGPAVQQRWRGKDFDVVMKDAERRKTVFERWLKANPDDMTTVIDPETKKVEKRRTTVDDLEAKWQKQPTSTRAESEAEHSAIEFARRFKNVAYKEKIGGQVFEMFETNPYRVIERTIGKQSAQVASAEKWGQNIPAAERKAMLAEHEAAVKKGEPGLPEPVLRNLQKGGVIERVNQYEQFGKQTLRDTTNLPDAVETARRLVSRAQGEQPVQRRGLARSQGWADFMAIRSAALSAAGGLRDVFDIVTRLPSFAGARRTIRSIAALALGSDASRRGLSRRDMFRYAEMTGAIPRQMGDYAVGEAKGWARKFADAVGYPSNFLERLKGVIATHAADDIIATARAGKATAGELQMMQDMMGLSAEDVLAFRDGKISPELEQRFRREFVATVTSKTPASEGSSFAASPNTRAWFNFINWFTRRTASHIKAMAAVKKHVSESGWTSPQSRRAVGRMLGIALGTTISGVLGNALVQTFTATLSGDPIDDGLKRAWDTFTYAPAATVLAGLKSGFVGGPLVFGMEAATNPDEGFAWSSMTAPSGVAYTLFNAAHAAARGDTAGFTEWVSRLGFVPFRTQIKEAIFGGLAGFVSDTQPRADASMVRAWEKLEGIERASAPRSKDEAFYDALAEVSKIAKANVGDPKKALAESADHIRKALALAPEESVAAAIEGRQFTKHLSLEQRQKLAEFVNDTARLERIYQHDHTLREMASTIRRTMEGAYPTPWEQDLEAIRDQASLGAADKWGSVIDRALDESANRMLSGDGMGDQIDQLAEVAAIYGDQIASQFDERTARFLTNPNVDSLTKARRISRVLRGRALERAKAERKRQAREAAGG